MDETTSYKFTAYFENEVLRKRPYIKKEWCIQVIENPIMIEKQEQNRYRFWGKIDELGGKILRVVTLEDQQTIHNAFPDRRFKDEN
ncbi:MAG: hypothetical protein HGB19_00635 [Chlorobiales bacterium]|nr:hypothetical protein [Chlorobiales bacterium]